MNTAAATNTLSVERVVPVSCLQSDLSVAAGGWVLEALGFDPDAWSVIMPRESGTRTMAITGLDSSESLRVEADWRRMVAYTPRTALGRRLWEIRSRIVASGEPLLDWDGIEGELAERRGERK